jgi:hypothetical protein
METNETGEQGGAVDTSLLGGTDEGTGTTGGEGDAPSPEELAAAEASKTEEVRRAALTDEERAAEDEAAAQKELDAKGAPEAYEDFKLPEGMQVDAAVLGEFAPLAKELNLSQGQAQKLVNMYTEKVLPGIMQAQTDAWAKTRSEWAAQAKADPVIGGEKFTANLGEAKRAYNTFATPELKSVMEQHGMGDHPEVIKLFFTLAKSMREDTIILPGSQPGSKKSPADILFGG